MHLLPADARLRDGTVLAFVEHGPSDGVPVVFLHGFSDHWRSFMPVLPHLPPRVRAVAVTMRGHGGASQPRAGYAISDFSRDLLEFIDLLRVDRVVLAGHSLGSAVALQAAIEAPERIAGVVLAPGFASLTGPAVDEFADAVHALTDPIDPGFVAALQQQAREPQLPSGLFASMVEHSRRMPSRVWHAVIDSVRDFDVAAELPRVTAPVLLVWGMRDAFVTGAAQETLLDGLPNTELVVFRAGGHTPHWDDPGRYGREVGDFAARAFAA